MRKNGARLRLIGMGAAAGLVALVLGMVWAWSNAGPAPQPRAAGRADDAAGDGAPRPVRRAQQEGETPPAVNTVERRPADGPADQGTRVRIVDSEAFPWASPTAGAPPTLAYLPPGSQVMLLARPAEVVADAEGRQFVRSLGPRVAEGIALLGRLCGCGLEGIEEVQAGWQAGSGEAGKDAGEVLGGWAVRLLEPSAFADDAAARDRAWGATTPKEVAGETIHVGRPLCYWLPAAAAGRVLVMAPLPLLEATVQAARDAGPDDGESLAASLPQDMQTLVGMLDRSRHLTVLGSPHYLLTDGRPLLAGPLARLVEPLGAFFGDGVRAAALSLHFGDAFYAEVDAIATRAEPPKPLAARLAQQTEKLADAVEDYCAMLDPHPYGRKLVMRLPAMIRVVAANARCGAEGRGVVLNSYLPRHAGHNLVLASELALEQSPGSGVAAVAAAKPAPGAAGGPTGGLEKKISLVFAKDTLEKSIQMLAEEIGMPMEILGGDLQLEGITKNQSFGLDERDKPAEEVLRTILAKSDSAGRLVYVIRRRDGVESIEITTKAAAAKRGDTLPK